MPYTSAARARTSPLVRVNCASIPRELFESEFFGHLRGSFSGATRDRAGRFQVADGGTLFLDEVGEIPLELQGKLLRALQEGQFSRVGEDHERTVDVRVIAATNRDLQKEVRAGRFREDLYYRLTVFPIRVPPMRERREDIPPIAQHFVETLSTGPPFPAPQATPGRSGCPRPVRLAGQRPRTAQCDPAQPDQCSGWPARAAATYACRQPQQPLLLKGPRRPACSPMVSCGTSNARISSPCFDHARWKIAGAGGAAEFLGLHPATLTSRLKGLEIERPRSTERRPARG